MTVHRILIVQGHPDPAGGHLCHALAAAYGEGASAAGHDVKSIDVAQLDFPLLRTQTDWNDGALPASLLPSQQAIAWAQHLVFVFPLWMGDMPALLKGYFEQVARPGFAFDKNQGKPFGQKVLGGRSARLVVTMGMPALVYRYVFRAHSVKSLERNILGFVGIAPIRETLVGQVDTLGPEDVNRWLRKLRRLGANAA
ncbi:MAG: NAD(P)H-dependent oxidoreductase [Pseudomonadota bacterium]|nr:NAD(P)H-dependent oxidoreductase [Pseudomonadota bacterium]